MIATVSPWWSKDTVAVVTGSNKGIGYEIIRGLAGRGMTVVVTARDASKGQAAVDALTAEAGADGMQHSVYFHPLDVNWPESVQALALWLKGKFGAVDILVNNAGANVGPSGKIVVHENAKAIVETNYYGVKNVTEALLPLLRAARGGARIVNVTSRLGLYDRLVSEALKAKFRDEDSITTELIDSMAEKYLEDVRLGRSDEEGWVERKPVKAPMYSESKMFMNAYAITLAKSLSSSETVVATFCPGITETDMLARGLKLGFQVPVGYDLKTAADGADTGVWLALLPKEELAPKNGKFFADRKEYLFSWTNPGF